MAQTHEGRCSCGALRYITWADPMRLTGRSYVGELVFSDRDKRQAESTRSAGMTGWD
jgi:hypothetical protein